MQTVESDLKPIDRASDTATAFAKDLGVNHRLANVFGEDIQRVSFTALQ